MAILGGIIAVVALFLSFAIQNHVHKETGVWVSRSNLRYVRRQARLKGIPEEQAYEEWMARKQQRLGVTGSMARPDNADPVGEPRSRKGGCSMAVLAGIIVLGLLLWLGSTLPSASPPTMAVVDRDRVNCRQSPSASSVVVTKLDGGKRVRVASQSGGWSQIQDPACWIRSDLLKSE